MHVFGVPDAITLHKHTRKSENWIPLKIGWYPTENLINILVGMTHHEEIQMYLKGSQENLVQVYFIYNVYKL